MSDWSMSGSAQVVSAIFRGFYGLPATPLVVAWDDRCATVRQPTGELKWFTDNTSHAFPRDGKIVIQDVATHPYPRGNRHLAALVVRSLEDLLEEANADQVTSIDAGGTIHIYGEHDNSRGQVVSSEDTGIILRASGVQGVSPWDFEVTSVQLVEADCGLLEPMDVRPPD